MKGTCSLFHAPRVVFTAIAAAVMLVGGLTMGQEAKPLPPPAPEAEDRHTHTAPVDAPPVPAPVAGASVRAMLGHDSYSRGTPQALVLKIDIDSPPGGPGLGALEGDAPVPPHARRPPLNLALVIDRSGSMAEAGKFDYAARAVGLVIENLSERDTVSLIAFNQDAVVLAPAGTAVNKAFLRHRLGEVRPEGWTNLSAGLLEAFAQIDTGAADGQNKRVIVLTDGLANRGVADGVQLRSMVETGRARGIAVSTMGVGTDFDPKLLASLAEGGGGRYSYARSAEQIPAMMESELAGFLAVTAQNARLDVVVEGGAKIARVFGRPAAAPTDRFSIDLGDLREGERGSFVLELTPGSFEVGDVVGVAATLTMDLPGRAQRVREVARASAAYTRDTGAVSAGEREAATVHAAALDVLEQAEQAVAGLDTGRMRQVSAAFLRVHERARAIALQARDQDLLNQAFMLKHFAEELDAASRAGLMHGHDEARRQIAKDADYQRYLMSHHRGDR